MLPLADGSDNAGSLRNPAAFNHVYAFRPSEGLIPAEGRSVCVPSLGVVGPMARCVDDLAAMLSTLAGVVPAPAGFGVGQEVDFLAALLRDFDGARIGWLGNLDGRIAIEAEVLRVCESSLGTFQALGCFVEAASLSFDMEKLWNAYCDLRSWLTGGALAKHYRNPRSRELLTPESIWEIERAFSLSAMQALAAFECRARWREALAVAFRRYDFLVLPAAQCLPFDAELDWPHEIAGRSMDSYHRWMEVAIPATMGACPVASVPAGLSSDGRPVGLQILVAPQRDLACLQLAKAYESASAFTNLARPNARVREEPIAWTPLSP
jgi:amidase